MKSVINNCVKILQVTQMIVGDIKSLKEKI